MSDELMDNLASVMALLRKEMMRDKKDIPIHWAEFFFVVASIGEKGITTKEVADSIGMTQGIASRTVKLMSTYWDPIEKKMAGADLLVTFPDHEYRQRQRIALSTQGKELIARVKKIIAKK